MKGEWKKPNKQYMGFILRSFKELSTCTLEGLMNLFGDQNAKNSRGVLWRKMHEGFALCHLFLRVWRSFQAYFLGFLMELMYEPSPAAHSERCLGERWKLNPTPKLVNLGWQRSLLEPGMLDPSLSPKSRRKCPMHNRSGLQHWGFPVPVSHLLQFDFWLCASLLGR